MITEKWTIVFGGAGCAPFGSNIGHCDNARTRQAR
jgi:hypothetical protein